MGMAKVRFRLITQFFMVVAFDTFILQSMIGVYGERRDPVCAGTTIVSADLRVLRL